jgi:hypothetical protein
MRRTGIEKSKRSAPKHASMGKEPDYTTVYAVLRLDYHSYDST